jgi:rare lipoprotein A (peptidoglycan hydrolase)
MKFQVTIGSTVAVLVLFSGAMADQIPPRVADKTASARQGPTGVPAADAIVEIAAVTQEVAQFAATAAIAAPPVAETTALVETSPPVKEAPDLAADAAETPPAKAASAPPKSASAPGKAAPAKYATNDKIAGKSDKHADSTARHEQVAVVDPKPILVRAVGKTETGTAAWYGGRYVGRRTSSGERLDTIHPTAAHRTLPLNSLARVTNLANGRSVVVRVTDRGPVADSLLIDVSPRAADELRMKEAGLIPVRVEQVVEVPPDAK